MAKSVRYPPELRDRAVRMVSEAVREGVYSLRMGGDLRGGADAGSDRRDGAPVGPQDPGRRCGGVREPPATCPGVGCGRTGSFDERTRS